MIFPNLLLKLHAWHFLIFEFLVVDMTPLPWLSILLTIYKSPHMSQWGESRLQWPKNVVTILFFQNYTTFNFHQANIKRVFHKLYSK
jgi:hypothetical protein